LGFSVQFGGIGELSVGHAGGVGELPLLLPFLVENSCPPPRRSLPFGSLGLVGLLLSSLDGGWVVVVP
jgi:hypothetical protein